VISLAQIFAHTPQALDFVWSMECPRLNRAALLPQCDLIRLDPNMCGKERVLFLPPISGHGGSLVQDLAKPLSKSYDVFVLDWIDPARLSFRHARYGLDTQVAGARLAIQGLLEGEPTKLHVVATCQAASPGLLALNQIKSTRLTLSLVAAPLFDGPGGVCDLFTSTQAEQTFSDIRSLITLLPNGAKALPAATQLTAIMHGQGGAMRILHSAMALEYSPLSRKMSRAATARRIALLSARSIPEPLLIEGLRSNFVNRDHLKSEIDPRIPVHLIAGGEDRVVPSAQCFAFEDQFSQINTTCSLFSKLDHFDLFSSSIARAEVSKRMNSFFADPYGAQNFSKF
jgi:pimeloyl-ACP methyl ester carboxylesterase